MLGAIRRASLLLVALTAVSHTSAEGFTPCCKPAGDYLEAESRIAQQQRTDDSVAIPGARSIFLTHNRRTRWAVVLLHGFGNSPRQFGGLADSLYAHGFNVWVPRMPHHGEKRGAGMLSRVTAEELRKNAEAATDIGVGIGDSVVVLGFSMGGVAAAWIAQSRTDVQRVVIVSPALALAHIPLSLTRPLVSVMLRLPDVRRGVMRDPTRSDRELGWSTHAVAQILRFGFAVQQAAHNSGPSVRDIRVLVNAHDHTVNAAAAVALAACWAAAGAHVSVYQLPDSLKLPHDVIDATEPGARPAVVQPIVEGLVDDISPPRWVMRINTGVDAGVGAGLPVGCI